ncbi:hypothetical protein DBR06_SOUSAS14510023, partial [Sousa chinensis]
MTETTKMRLRVIFNLFGDKNFAELSTETQGNVGINSVTMRSSQGKQESECHPQRIS